MADLVVHAAPSESARKAAEIVRRVADATPDRLTGRMLHLEARLLLLEDVAGAVS